VVVPVLYDYLRGVTLALGYIPAGEARYDITHLRTAKYRLVLKKTAKHPKLICIYLVKHRSHCACSGPKRGDVFDFSILGKGLRIVDEKGDERCFNKLRWELSHLLGRIMKTLPRRHCKRMSRQVWLTTETVWLGGELKEYEVYFTITKQDKQTLRIIVVSAYVRDPDYGDTKPTTPKPRRRVPGKILLANTLLGRPIRC